MKKEMTLFINACVRKESRTKRLADRLLEKLGGEGEDVRLVKAVGLDLAGADPEAILRDAMDAVEAL